MTMPDNSEATTSSRVPLSRTRVLDAAVAYADAWGLETLTMRKLAELLDAAPMALYRHVSSKDDLLDGMIDLVYGEIDVPSEDGDWKLAMRQQAISARETVSRHPWAIRLIESSATPGRANLRYHDSVLGILRRSGFSIAMAIHVFTVLDSYIYGFALQQMTMPFDSAEDLTGVAQDILQQFPSDEYPYLAETLSEYVGRTGYDFSDEFEFGLDLILGALDQYLNADRS
jgi:AcrR family transcriptional regulator